jgi:pyruvate/2-oxoglutarate dehydrogenase complex dihydrolipoamide dehydrogenase (E3) component
LRNCWLTAGVSNINFLKDSGIELGKGIKVNRFLETNIKDIYAIGDCAEQHEAIDRSRLVYGPNDGRNIKTTF